MPDFSRRHYNEIADVIKVKVLTVQVNRGMTGETTYDIELATIRDMVDKLCIMFEADNPNFKRQAFIDACGL